ncbi:class E sortase [Streptomyces sp. SCUT-3]|nr:class E sortase [Streptomyces sp. DJ]QMV22486.1 class E sortase [Streptomyces sp. SCUT-3]
MTTAQDSENDQTSGPAAAAGGGTGPASRRGRGIVAATVSFVGELLITVGLVLALFVAYSLWWTNVLADREAGRDADRVRQSWSDKGPGELDTKDGVGFLHVPAMDDDPVLVKKGTDGDILNAGVAGYYTDPIKAALPWEKDGNFSLAAHRDGHGAKFHNIHKMKDGDPVVLETKDTWYVYKVYKTLPSTSKFDVDVLQQIPEKSGATKKSKYITLTTCTPMYTSDYRYIVWGELERTEKVDADRTPPKELRG